jgi:hypothetical protein
MLKVVKLNFTSAIAYLDFHEYVSSLGFAYFFAIPTLSWLTCLVAILDSKADGNAYDYSRFRASYDHMNELCKVNKSEFINSVCITLQSYTKYQNVLE